MRLLLNELDNLDGYVRGALAAAEERDETLKRSAFFKQLLSGVLGFTIFIIILVTTSSPLARMVLENHYEESLSICTDALALMMDDVPKLNLQGFCNIQLVKLEYELTK